MASSAPAIEAPVLSQRLVNVPNDIGRNDEFGYVLRRLGLSIDCGDAVSNDTFLYGAGTLNGVRVPMYMPVQPSTFPSSTTIYGFCLDYDSHVSNSKLMPQAKIWVKNAVSHVDHVVRAACASFSIPVLPPPCGMYIFTNGILDLRSLSFKTLDDYELQPGHRAQRFFPFDFDPELLTTTSRVPELECILDAQAWPAEQVRCFKAFMGRMAFPIKSMDGWDAAPVIIGEAGAGKTTIVDAVLSAFNDPGDVRTMGSRPAKGFETGHLGGAKAVHFSDVDRKFVSCWDADTIKKLITGEPIVIRKKYCHDHTVDWRAPVVFTSNARIAWKDKGMIRRCVYFSFDLKPVTCDTSLQKRLREPKTQVRLICHLVRIYHDVRADVGDRVFSIAIPEVYPQHAEVQDAIHMENDPLYQHFHETFRVSADPDAYVGRLDIDAAAPPGQAREFLEVVKAVDGVTWVPQLKVKNSTLYQRAWLEGKRLKNASQGYAKGLEFIPKEDASQAPPTSVPQDDAFGAPNPFA